MVYQDHRLLMDRTVFDKPLSAYQLPQKKLAEATKAHDEFIKSFQVTRG